MIRKYKEHYLQADCIKWFNLAYPHLSSLLFAVPNAALRTKSEAGILKAEGMKAGVADVIFQMPNIYYSSLNIEMKIESKNSKQSESQLDFEEAVKMAGGDYQVCRNFQEFQAVVVSYIAAIDPQVIARMRELHARRQQRSVEKARNEYARLVRQCDNKHDEYTDAII